MDELDAEIIRLLQSDARLSNRELARRLGIAPSTCLERVRALTRRGVVRGYHAEIDLKALNRGVQALIAVQVRPLRRSVIEAFKDSVGKLPEVMTVFVLAGGDDFLLHVAVQDLDHLHAFLLDRLSKRGEIIGFRTSVIFQRAHNTVLSRLPDDEHAGLLPLRGRVAEYRRVDGRAERRGFGALQQEHDVAAVRRRSPHRGAPAGTPLLTETRL